jgi:hypothetical protein
MHVLWMIALSFLQVTCSLLKPLHKCCLFHFRNHDDIRVGVGVAVIIDLREDACVMVRSLW